METNKNSLLVDENSSESLKPSPSVVTTDQDPNKSFWDIENLHQWKGFWYATAHLEAARDLQAHFESRDDDVVLTSSIKTGTAWLKALCFCIMQGHKSVNEKEEEDPLLENHPTPHLSGMPSPRLFHTHIPYTAIPDSIKNSECKIVYITRNPKDTLVSMWHFFNSIRKPEQDPIPFEKAFESFCDGVHPFGPFLDHVLEFWEESLKRPHKILFLRYEEMKRDPKGEVKKLASFLGRPFANEEEVEKVLRRCSLDRLKNLEEVNKNGVTTVGVPKSAFFRRGVVGDFSQEMQERLDQITRMKLEKTQLELELA